MKGSVPSYVSRAAADSACQPTTPGVVPKLDVLGLFEPKLMILVVQQYRLLTSYAEPWLVHAHLHILKH